MSEKVDMDKMIAKISKEYGNVDIYGLYSGDLSVLSKETWNKFYVLICESNIELFKKLFPLLTNEEKQKTIDIVAKLK